jgi:hypothetical protein
MKDTNKRAHGNSVKTFQHIQRSVNCVFIYIDALLIDKNLCECRNINPSSGYFPYLLMLPHKLK